MPATHLKKIFFGIAVLYACQLQGQNSLVQQSSALARSFLIKDSLFKNPFIDKDEWRDLPIKHRYIHGGFSGTNTLFSLYFPVVEKYKGHFFQYITPFPDNENLSQGSSGEDDKIGFAVSHGAYFIETNGGGRVDFSKPNLSADPSVAAYRANAASALFSKTVAAALYGNHKTYGYAFGGSGGAYRTIGGIENTEGVWDGTVPYVVGSPMAIPNVFSVRMHAMRILNDKLPQIIDALEPGGSGDMFAGLNTEEKEALQEVTKMGFPPKSWFGYKTMGVHGFIALYQGVVMADRKYFDEFWKVKGYLGATPTASLTKARLQKPTKINAGIALDAAINLGLKEPVSANERGSADLAWKSIAGAEGDMPVAFQLEDELPDVNFIGGDLIIKSGAAAGRVIQLVKATGNKVVFGPTDPTVLALIKKGDDVIVDNSNFLASQTYHRHQVPGKEYKVWDQFRTAAGEPLYPQRPMLLGPLFTKSASGVLPNGKFKGKMILLASLWDREAFPWQADWYRSQVKKYLSDSADNYFRLWYTDRALHGDLSKQEDPTRTVSYLGVLQQALLDLSQWVEKGIEPPASTQYSIEDGQVIVPASAKERKGIQPVIDLLVAGKKAVTYTKGKTVIFTATIEVPFNTGKIIAADFDFDGTGTFKTPATFKVSSNGKVEVKISHTFNTAGVFFPTIRVCAQRNGNVSAIYTRIQNLDRVRVIIK